MTEYQAKVFLALVKVILKLVNRKEPDRNDKKLLEEYTEKYNG